MTVPVWHDLAERCAECVFRMKPGDCHEWLDPTTGRWIYNLATQPRPGPCASLLAIKSALDNMLACSRGARVKRIGICRVGTGYGGLRWEDVRPLIERAARDVDIVVVHKETRGVRR